MHLAYRRASYARFRIKKVSVVFTFMGGAYPDKDRWLPFPVG
jgi:hypothetical protein